MRQLTRPVGRLRLRQCFAGTQERRSLRNASPVFLSFGPYQAARFASDLESFSTASACLMFSTAVNWWVLPSSLHCRACVARGLPPHLQWCATRDAGGHDGAGACVDSVAGDWQRRRELQNFPNKIRAKYLFIVFACVPIMFPIKWSGLLSDGAGLAKAGPSAFQGKTFTRANLGSRTS